MAERFNKDIAGSKLVVFDQCGHVPNFEKPAEFNAAVIKFLTERSINMKFKVGDSAEITKKIDQADIDAFANVTGDHNPVHVDEEFAKTTRFGRRIAHGMLTASLISSVLANKLPGEGSVYLGQIAPVRCACVSRRRDHCARHRQRDSRRQTDLKLETICVNQRDEIVIRGEATVLCSLWSLCYRC